MAFAKNCSKLISCSLLGQRSVLQSGGLIHTQENLIVKRPTQAVLKAKSCFCQCSDTVSSCLVFVPFKQLSYWERKDQTKSRERELEREGIVWTRESLLTYRETQSASTLDKSLALSKPAFHHIGNDEDAASVLSDLWGGEFLLCFVSSYLLTLQEQWCLDRSPPAFSPPLFLESSQSVYREEVVKAKHNTTQCNSLCHSPSEPVSSLSLSLRICKMRIICTWNSFYKNWTK